MASQGGIIRAPCDGLRNYSRFAF